MYKKIGFELRSLLNLMQRKGNDGFSVPNNKMTPMHGYIIKYLSENENKDISQKELEEFLSVRGSTLSRMLKLMESNGFIQRESSKTDSRKKLIILTEKAKKIRQNKMMKMDENMKEILTGISEEELEVFFKVISQLKANLGDYLK